MKYCRAQISEVGYVNIDEQYRRLTGLQLTGAGAFAIGERLAREAESRPDAGEWAVEIAWPKTLSKRVEYITLSPETGLTVEAVR